VTSEPKAFASLSSGLLARKGSARPAMRPQGFGQGGGNLDDLGWNDMGHEPQRPVLTAVSPTNELHPGASHVAPPLSRTPLAGLTPISAVHDQQAEIEQRLGQSNEEAYASADAADDEAHAQTNAYEQEVAEELEALELLDALPVHADCQVEDPVVPVAPVAQPVAAPSPRPAPKRSREARSEQNAKDKAAFTLRLDSSRHLKLRLACAVNAKSAQQLVTKALDELLSSMPELDAMASQAPERASRKG
jgi:hypothetical protein